MFDLFHRGRTLLIDCPLTVDELTRRLEREVASPSAPRFERRQQAFQGTFADGQFKVIRVVTGRNSFRPWLTGRVLPGPNGARVEARLRMSPVVLVFGLLFAIVAGTVAAVAAPEIGVVNVSPFVARVLAMAAVFVFFAALGSLEARITTTLLSTVVGVAPGSASAASRR